MRLIDAEVRLIVIAILVHNPEFRAAPAAPTPVRVDVVNNGDRPTRARLEVLGAPTGWIEPVQPDAPLQPGETWRTTLVFTVPASASRGNHRLAIRVTDQSTGETTIDDSLVLTVASHEGLSLSLTPASLRGRFRARSRVIISNRSAEPVHLDLSGDAEALRLRFRPAAVDVPAGEERVAKVRVRSRPRWLGYNRRPLSVIGSGAHLPVRTEGSFEHRPVFGSTSKAISVATLLIGIAIGAFFGLLRVFDSDETSSADSVDSSSDAADTDTADAATGGSDGGTSDEDDSSDGDGNSDNEGPSSRLTLEGTVVLAGAEEDENSGVEVTLRRISLDGTEETSALSERAKARANRKIFALAQTHAQSLDDTNAPITVTTAANGRWTHTDLIAGLHYEVSFRRLGYTTQSFVISPERGVELAPLEIELDPGDGILSGIATSPSGPTGGALVRVTDGELVYTATTSTDTETLGRWTIEGLATPARYIVTIEQRGFGTEVFSVELSPGETQTSLSTQLVTGVGSITGVVRADGDGYGGVTVTASSGDVSVTTTTLTTGSPGAFTLPRLPVGLEYKLEIAADGWLGQTRSITVNGSVDDLVIDLVAAYGTVGGSVSSDQSAVLGDVSVTISSDALSFRTTTEASEGRWQVTGVPPGEYQIAFSRFNHADAFANITVTAGAASTVTDPVLVFSPDEVVEANATLTGVLRDNKNQPVVGATVELPSHQPALQAITNADGRYEINGINFGSYLVRIIPAVDAATNKKQHQDQEDFATFTLNETVSFSPTLFTNGAFNGSVKQAAAPGVAVPNATLTVTGTSIGVPAVLVPDSTGSFNEPDFFPPGEYTLLARAPGYLPATETRTIPEGLPVPITVDFELNLRPRLLINVVEPTGTGTFGAITDATVTLNPPADGTTGVVSKAVDAATGIAEFAEESVPTPGPDSTRLVAGTYTIDVTAPGRDSLSGFVVGGVAVAENREVTVALTDAIGGTGELATGVISYRRDGADVPISGATVTANVITSYVPATPPDDPTPRRVDVADTTDVTGTWTAPEHRFGEAAYTVVADNFATGTVNVDVTPGVGVTGDLTLVAESSELEGRLLLTTTDAGSTLDSFEVTATGPGGVVVGPTPLQPDGSYVLTVDDQGTWSVDIGRIAGDDANFDGLPAVQSGIQTVPGGQTDVPTITATELASVLVPVSPATATVQLCDGNGENCGTGSPAVAGTASFSLLPAGQYTVTVSEDGFRPETSAPFELDPGEDETLGLLDLETLGTIEGRLLGRAGSVLPSDSILAGITVTATETGGSATFTDETDADGIFSIAAPDGSYDLTFDLIGYNAAPAQPATLTFTTAVETTNNIGDVIFQTADVSVDIEVRNELGALIDATVNLRQADEPEVLGEVHLASSSPLTVGPIQPRTWTVEVSAVGHNSVSTVVAIPAGGLSGPIVMTAPRNTGSIEGTIRGVGANGVDIGPVASVDIARISPTGTGVTSEAASGYYYVVEVKNGATDLQFSKSGYETQDVRVVVNDQEDPTIRNVELVPNDGTITLTISPNATADFTALKAQLWLDTDAAGTQMIGQEQTVGVDRSVTFTVRPSKTALASPRLHHYRIELFGTGFDNRTVDNLDLLPGGTLTPDTTVVSTPAAPSMSSVAALETGGVRATWTAPADTGGAPITGYVVEWDIGSAGTYINSTTTTGTTADITAVNPGDQVSVRVRATNAAGSGSPSSALSATAPSPPDQVGVVTADAENGPLQVDLSWNAPAANGSTITSYDIEYKATSTPDWTGATATTSATTTASITAGLSAGTSYDFRVRAVNGVGDGTFSDTVSATAADVPDAPGSLSITHGDQELSLTWSAPATNGSPITTYEYRIDNGTIEDAGSNLNETITGLINGTEYSIDVRAVNAIGPSAWSNATGTPKTIPDPPAPTATAGTGQITVTWTAPSDGGATITRYDLRHRATETTNWTEINNVTSPTNIPSLTNGTEYEVQLRATNIEGDSNWSTSATATPS